MRVDLKLTEKLRHVLIASVLPAVSIIALLTGCTLKDDRDLCCPDQLTMYYTYRPLGAEAFSENIFSLRHFLFNGEGILIGEIPPGNNLQHQPLSLNQGEYTLITLGNYTDRSAHDHGDMGHQSQFTLIHTARYDGSYENTPDDDPEEYPRLRETLPFRNSDELFWGIKRFTVNAEGLGADIMEGRSGEASNRLVTRMNNIHCHLNIMVDWSNMPPHIGDYEMELDGVASRYSLNPQNTSTTPGGFIVPEGKRLASYRLKVPLRSQTLKAEFVTLRFTNTIIPTLRVYFGNTQVSPDIDLGKAFRSWGWRPSDTHIQEYKILVRITGDGSAEVFPKIEASVDDWINGGSFG